MVQDQAADGVEFLVGEIRGEGAVEVVDLGLRLHPVAPRVVDLDVAVGLVEVVLVLDVADDLLQDVLDRHQPAGAAVLVDDDRHVVARHAELAQQHVEALRLGDEYRRAQPGAQVEACLGMDAQQVLGQQDADDVVATALDDREARVPGGDDEGEDLVERIDDVDDVHLRARHHHVADAGIGRRERAFDDRQCVRIEQVALEGGMQELQKLFAVLRLAQEERRETFQKSGSGTRATVHKLCQPPPGAGKRCSPRAQPRLRSLPAPHSSSAYGSG